MGLSFLSPYILLALLALPLLWRLMRATPPAPRNQTLPTLRFLANLPRRAITPRSTPWWLLALRLILATCLILGLSAPVVRKQTETPLPKTINLVMDNSWASQSVWPEMLRAANNIIDRAANQNTTLTIITTTPEPGKTDPVFDGPVAPARAREIIGALHPAAWPAHHIRLARMITDRANDNAATIWIGHGIAEQNTDATFNAFMAKGNVTYLGPGQTTNQPLRLSRNTNHPDGELAVTIDTPQPFATDTPLQINIRDTHDNITAVIPVTLPAGHLSVEQVIDAKLLATARRLDIAGHASAAGTLLLDGLIGKKNVAIIAPTAESGDSPLATASYYLRRALEPYASLSNVDITQKIDDQLDIIIATDLADPDPDAAKNLIAWTERGGILLRFAGPNTAATRLPDLLPVPLHTGNRTLSGLGTWATPPKLKPFADGTPLAALTAPDDLNLHQQLLAEPGPTLAAHTWAALDDGTPFITARNNGNGMIILVHTAADPSWSDLPLTGFFVPFLKQVLSLSHNVHVTATNASHGDLRAQQIIDVNGNLTAAPANIPAIPAQTLGTQMPDARHPAGFYGDGGTLHALNLGDRIDALSPLNPPASVTRETFASIDQNIPLQPVFLTIAAMLFLLDIIALMVIQGAIPLFRRAATIAIILACITPATANAANDTVDANLTHLAYIQTGDPAIDATSRTGLETILRMLKQRTSVSTGSVYAVNPARDDTSLYPVIYWPVRVGAEKITPPAAENIRTYMAHGGLILFDTADRATTNPLIPTANMRTLQSLLARLGVGGMQPMGNDHVLHRSFYLLDTFPGALDGAGIYVLQTTTNQNDGVSPVLIGSNDWARIWAQPIPDDYYSGASQQQEMAIRFGINVVMYALTGNYKADQVHIPFLLERLGQGKGVEP